MNRLIRFQVKFNFILHIQLIFQLVRKRINWLLSNGTNLPNPKTRFYCKAYDDDDDGCNVELWKNKYHKADRNSIIPIHNIYSRFVSSEFVVGIRTPKTYMAVRPINRQFYL